jgi:hypothetical protein
MGAWKSLVERMKDARDELARKAAKKAAQTALDSAGKAMGAAGKALERALFGDLDADVAPKKDDETPRVDPFAKLKAAEAAQKERLRVENAEQQRAADQKKIDQGIDAELAAMKKKLGK